MARQTYTDMCHVLEANKYRAESAFSASFAEVVNVTVKFLAPFYLVRDYFNDFDDDVDPVTVKTL